MACYLVELYSPNATWNALPREGRIQFLNRVAAGFAKLPTGNVEVLALTETDRAIYRATPHRFLGIWRFDNPESRDALLSAIRATGWYEYFEHVNASGCGFTNDLNDLANV
ncbi:DUF6616 family protein [Lysobacter sp.]|uniref:DUF6616 family protein n=1 Tax=Lysobacter sp. TaxID=72226 RepID=UPI002D3E9357|nr:DUF6616 family protein [Lysobacter sp.]HZX78203.1 DUF6616 family protein [Lysobacter sp.]